MCLKRVVFKMQLLSRVYKVSLVSVLRFPVPYGNLLDFCRLTYPFLPSSSSQPILSTHLFLSALGSILNSVLARMLQEIIALQDITTKESHRLNEVCKMIHPLEELFVEEVGMVSASSLVFPLSPFPSSF